MRSIRPFSAILSNSSMDCGLASLATVLKSFGFSVSLEALRRYVPTDLQGTSMSSLAAAAQDLGLEAIAGQAKSDALSTLPLPAIAHLHKREAGHFVTIYKVHKGQVYIADPTLGLVKYSEETFLQLWTRGIVLFAGSPNDKAAALRRPSNARNVLNLFRAESSSIALITFLTFCAAFAAVSVSSLLSHEINRLSSHSSPSALWPIIAICIVTGVRIAAGYLAHSTASRSGVVFEEKLALRYLETIMHAPLLFLEGRSIGEYLSRLTDIRNIRRTFLGVTVTLMVDGALLIMCCVWLMSVTVWSGLGLTCLIALLQVIIMTFGRRLFTINLSTKRHVTKLYADFVEKIGNVKAIKATGAEADVLDTLRSALNDSLLGVKSAEHESVKMDLLLQMTSGLTLVVILFIGVHRVNMGSASLGGLVMVVWLTNLFTGGIERAAPAIAAMQEASISASALADLLEHIPRTEEVRKSVEKPYSLPCGLALRKVTFGYSPSQLSVRDISLVFTPGECVCILGKTGSGKSTLACLLAGLYAPLQGEIILYSAEGEQHRHRLRDTVGVLFQESGLMSGSIRSNIVFGAKGATDDAIRQSAGFAMADEFINEKPQGYEYEVGAKGSLLSTGQRQRVALAGVFLRRPSILILDEATSGIDPVTEERILSKLRATRAGLTTIVITHRVHTATNFGRCIILQDGRLLADGDPGKLLESYSEMFST